jgi:cyclopropane fatty-acyl-phospholipid synthase-like methyltransferase
VQALHVLEIGCGQGACTLFLASLCPEVSFHGIDITPKHVGMAEKHRLAGKYGNAQFSVHDATALGSLGEDTYDLVFGIEALCHLDTPVQRHAFLVQVYSKLAPGGRVVIIDGFRSPLFPHASHHQQAAMRYAETGFRINTMPSKKDWLDLALDLNFSVVEDRDLTSEVLPFWELGWRFAHFLLHFPAIFRWAHVTRRGIAHTAANCLAVATTAHALRNRAAAEYGMLVLQKK